MRHLIVDTETTGLDPKLGHRIIEVAVLELVDRRHTGRFLHFHVDPERDVDAGAAEVHGMTWDDLRGKPKFSERAAELAEFLRGAEWVIHNAPFDLGFLDAEFARNALPCCTELAARVVDTLALARDTFPGKRNNLDALCERFGVSNAHRTLHGALLDAQLLAEVYLAMTRGQETLIIDMQMPSVSLAGSFGARDSGAMPRYVIHCIIPDAAELAAHRSYLEALARESKAGCLWLSLEQEAQSAYEPEVALPA
jgi:DNA polymerase-3 subunit epsilon